MKKVSYTAKSSTITLFKSLGYWKISSDNDNSKDSVGTRGQASESSETVETRAEIRGGTKGRQVSIKHKVTPETMVHTCNSDTGGGGRGSGVEGILTK